MIDIVEFVLARLDEDARIASKAESGPWHIGNAAGPAERCSVQIFPQGRAVAAMVRWADADHIAQWHPARVLAEVEVKRRLLDCWATAGEFECPADIPAIPAVLAMAYTEHPDYREEWRAW